MLAAQRRQLILDAVRTSRGAGVVQLAQQLDVSEMTVRRDLAYLARERKLTRVRGGAVSQREEPPFAEIAVERLEEKERVGRAAAELVRDGQAIMIDIGTTTLQLARRLHGRELTVITSNLAVIEELVPDESIELVVLGGIVRRNYRSLVGVLAEDALRQLHADVSFIGASGIRDDLAVMDTSMIELPIKRGMIEASACVVLLVDAMKFSLGGVVRICGPEELDILVTDAGVDEPGVGRLREAGVEVVAA